MERERIDRGYIYIIGENVLLFLIRELTFYLLGEIDKSDVQDFILQSHEYLSIKEMTANFDQSDESFFYYFRKDSNIAGED